MVVFSDICMDQWIYNRAELSTTSPSPSPSSLLFSAMNSFHPKTNLDLSNYTTLASQESEGVRFKLPSHLSRTDRAGLGSWLATRKAESDKKHSLRGEDGSRRWLQGNTGTLTSQGDRLRAVREGLLRARDGGRVDRERDQEKQEPHCSQNEVNPVSVCMEKEALDTQSVDRRVSVKEGLLAAWRGSTQEDDKIEDPISAELEKSIGEGRKEMEQSLASINIDSWLVKDYKDQEKDTDSMTGMECWLVKDRNQDRVTTPCVEDITPNSSQYLLSDWAGFHKEESIVPEDDEQDVELLAVKDDVSLRLKMSLMSFLKESEPVENEASETTEDIGESEASIITLGTSVDPAEDFDDFSDMQLELSQWISK